jgi:hypothetical protein
MRETFWSENLKETLTWKIMWENNITIYAGKIRLDKFWIECNGGLLWTW